SRTYLMRGGQLTRISKDHSLVMRLVDIGQITEEEIYTHPHRNAILRSLGEKPEVQTDTFPLRLAPGDALFLCSDGQWEMVHDPRMSEVITTVDDPQAACNQLVDEANANGGEDNITAVLVRFGE
ncbi:MAG: Serine/threonine phosphatase, partial [uncultured Chloroflexia bacterium]